MTQVPEDVKGEYRKILAPAVRAAKACRGDEASANEVVNLAIAAEAWIKATFPERPPHEVEPILTATSSSRAPTPTLDQILERAIRRPSLFFTNHADLENSVQNLNISLVRVNGVLVPPDPHEPGIQPGDGGDGRMREVRFINRLSMVLEALRERGVYSDDVVLHVGTLRPGQMRACSYVLVEIPRLQGDILVCDQVGEATFVSSRPLGVDAYQRLTKSELLTTPGVVRVVHTNDKDWLDAVFSHLSQNVVDQKVHIKDMLDMRAKIKEHFTPEQFLECDRLVKIEGLGLIAVARLFKSPGDPFASLGRLELCARIWGEQDSRFAEELRTARANDQQQRTLGSDPLAWRAAFEEAGLSPERLLKLPQTTNDGSASRNKTRIAGLGLASIATRLESPRDPLRNRLGLLELCAKLWGEDHPSFAEELPSARAADLKQKTVGADPVAWRAAFEEAGLSPERLLALPARARHDIRIAGRGLWKIAALFQSPGDPITSLGCLELCARLWGEDHPSLAGELQTARSDDLKRKTLGADRLAWRAAFEEAGLSPERLLKLPKTTHDGSASLNNTRIEGLGLTAIASLLNSPRNPMSSLGCLELCATLWGEDHPSLAADLHTARANDLQQRTLSADPLLWRAAFEEAGLSPERLLALPAKPRKDTKIAGLGLEAIARLLKSPGNPILRLGCLELCARLWGEDHPGIADELRSARAIDQQQRTLGSDPLAWRAAFEEAGLSAERLLKLPHTTSDGSASLNNIRIAGLGLKGIAPVLGSPGHPIGQRLARLELCARLWGEDDPSFASELKSARQAAAKS
jgi:hypothetical protein